VFLFISSLLLLLECFYVLKCVLYLRFCAAFMHIKRLIIIIIIIASLYKVTQNAHLKIDPVDQGK